MTLSDRLAKLARAVASVDPAAWELAGDLAGYGQTQEGFLSLISQTNQAPAEGDVSYLEAMADDIRARLPLDQQAAYNAGMAGYSPGTVDRASEGQTYVQAAGWLAQGATGIAQAGVGLITSPLTGVARGGGEAVGGILSGAVGGAARGLGTSIESLLGALKWPILIAVLLFIAYLYVKSH
jgi:hypothetical protein